MKALPKMVKAAQNATLKQAFKEHLEQTRGHVQRIEEIFEGLDGSPKGKKCVGMEGLIAEASELMKEDGEEAVIDAGLILAAQKVEHYEIAGYGSLCTYAEVLGETEARGLLDETLQEEKVADEKLSQIAESNINAQAANGEGDEEERNDDGSVPARARTRGRVASRSAD